MHAVAKSARAVQENMQKLHRDRGLLQELISDMMTEMAAEGTFSSLTDKVQEYHSDKRRKEETILQLVHGNIMKIWLDLSNFPPTISVKSHAENV